MWRRLALAVAVLISAAAAWLWSQRDAGLDAYAAHAYSQQPAAGDLTATWFGVTALLLADGQHAVFIDPFFTRPPGLLNLALNRQIAPDEPLIRQQLQQAGIQHLDAVLVSHTHYDHAMDAGVVARLTGAPLLGSASTLNVGRGAGLAETQLRQIQPGVPVTIGSFTITFIESRHAGKTGGTPTGEITAPLTPPARYLDYKLGGAYSILVQHAQGSVLHHGSAGYVPGALAGRHADIVFLGVALIDDLPEYLRETVDAVGARRVVPVHWDDFSRPLIEPLRPFPLVVQLDKFFSAMQQRPELQLQTLQLGRPSALFPKALAK